MDNQITIGIISLIVSISCLWVTVKFSRFVELTMITLMFTLPTTILCIFFIPTEYEQERLEITATVFDPNAVKTTYFTKDENVKLELMGGPVSPEDYEIIHAKGFAYFGYQTQTFKRLQLKEEAFTEEHKE
jgi:hypothetical protein